jgi:hypothetical protein
MRDKNKCIKTILSLFSSVHLFQLVDNKIIINARNGLPCKLIDRINNYDKDQIYIVYHTLLAPHKKSVIAICDDLHISEKQFNIIKAQALEKLQDYFFNNTF